MKTNKNKQTKIIVISLIVTILWILGFYLYVTYNKIEVNDKNYTAIRTRIHI